MKMKVLLLAPGYLLWLA